MVELEKLNFDMLWKNEKTSEICEKRVKIKIAFPEICAYNKKAILWGKAKKFDGVRSKGVHFLFT